MNSRQEFENWAHSKGLQVKRWYDGYYSLQVDTAWQAWQYRDVDIMRLQAKIMEMES